MSDDGLKVDAIDQLEALKALRANWDAVYAADPEANLFLSWVWMSKWLHLLKSEWFILAARPSEKAENYVAFFPLRVRTASTKNNRFYTEILMAGNRTADYTGFICAPRWTESAIPAFARVLRSMSWLSIHFEQLRMSENNMMRLLNCFADKQFQTLRISTVEPDTGIDQSICPYVALPSDWEIYLSTQSSNLRQKLRRLLRQVEADPELHITHTGPATLDRDVEVLVDLWGRQWQDQKGDETRTIQANFRVMLKMCCELGILFMPILWKGDKAIGVLASVIDEKKKALHFYVGTRDKTFSKPQPGLTLHAHSIRHAIGLGIKEYDFLRGNEDYKYTFGARDRQIRGYVIRFNPSTRKKSVLDVRGIPEALFQVNRLHAKHDFAAAEFGYRQILSVDPKCTKALWAYGQLKLRQGRIAAARKLFDAIASTNELPDRVSLGLGQCQAAQGRWTYAKAYYQRAIALNPKLVPAHYHLGVAQEKKGELEDAIVSYRKVVAHRPRYRDAKARLDNAVLQAERVGSLPPLA